MLLQNIFISTKWCSIKNHEKMHGFHIKQYKSFSFNHWW